MDCEICGMSFPVKTGVVIHKLIEHKINENGNKISKLFKSMQTEDLMNSSDSECEYKFVLSVQRVPKIEKDSQQLATNKSNDTTDFNIIEKRESNEYLDYNESICDVYIDAIDEDSSTYTFDYQCYICKEQYEALSSLQDHLNRLHRIVDKRKPIRGRKKKRLKKNQQLQRTFLCNYCGKVFSYQTTYKNHMRGHENYRPYKCDICTDVAYTTRRALMWHMNRHTGEKQYICTFEGCHKLFSQAGVVKLHWINAHGPREHKCTFCDKSFSCKKYLDNHIRVHTRERPFRCEFCFQSFALESTVRRHKRIHTVKEQYKCEICQKGFTTQRNLRVHNQKVKCKSPGSTASA